MRLLVYTHPSALDHDTGLNHPERPARIEAVLAGVRNGGVTIEEIEAPALSPELLAGVHGERYVESIRRFCASGGGYLDPDTHVSAASWDAALRSAGAGPAAIAALDAGGGDAAFIVMRPPGHHALESRAMGFCLFNNIAVAAHQLADRGDRVAIVDWDVHHGNGTQTMFYTSPDVLYLSVHEFPAYPGTGWADELGAGAGTGTTINIPLPAGSGGGALRVARERIIHPILDQFRPDWVLVSAGYDAHVADPLAALRFEAADYAAFAADIGSTVPAGRIVFFLEGGYNLQALSASAEATVRGLAGIHPHLEEERGAPQPKPTAAHLLDFVVSTARPHWDVR